MKFEIRYFSEFQNVISDSPPNHKRHSDTLLMKTDMWLKTYWMASNNITQQKICYNWEYACEEILADNSVSVFKSYKLFIQTNCSNRNHLLLQPLS